MGEQKNNYRSQYVKVGIKLGNDDIEEIRNCINCIHLDGVECGLEREEDFEDGKDCLEFVPWWDEN